MEITQMVLLSHWQMWLS